MKLLFQILLLFLVVLNLCFMLRADFQWKGTKPPARFTADGVPSTVLTTAVVFLVFCFAGAFSEIMP